MFISASTFFSLPVLQDDDVAVLVAEIDLAVDDDRRAPDRREQVVHPVRLPRLGVEAVEEPAEVGDVDEAVGDRRRRDRPADLVEVPDPAALGDVAALGRVDRVEVADALAVLRVLPVGDVDAVVDR